MIHDRRHVDGSDRACRLTARRIRRAGATQAVMEVESQEDRSVGEWMEPER